MPTSSLLSYGRPAGRPALLRSLNSLNALTLAQHAKPQTAAHIARAIGVSRTAVEAILADLLQAGWLTRVAASGADSPGRPAARYGLASGVGHIVAVEFDSACVGVSVANVRGDVLGVARREVEESLPGPQRVALGVELVAEALTTAKVAASSIRCVSVASPGVITDGRVAHFGGHGMPGWIGQDLGATIRDALHLPVVVEGDSALAALAERRVGAGTSVEDFVYIYSGRRTGAAIISGGRLLRGAHGATGLVGELSELRWRELEAAAYGETPMGDEAAILGLGISALVLAVDPAAVLIGGPSLDRLGPLLDDVRREVARRCPVVPPVGLGHFGADAVMRGAVWLALDAISAALAQAVSDQGILPSPEDVGQLIG